MNRYLIVLLPLMAIALSPKNKYASKTQKMEDTVVQQDSFAYDEAFLKDWDNELVVLGVGEAKVAISAKYQARVFTSTVAGKSGQSLGWINYDAFGKIDPHMNAYGGENRFWLGPEGNVFSLFFRPGSEMTFENWKTPAPIDSEPWNIVEESKTSVTMGSDMELKNYNDYDFKIKAERKVTLLTTGQIEELLGVGIKELKVVGYKTKNTITNIGRKAWTKETGAPCIWILDMFPPSGETTIVIPYKTGAGGEVATTNYFGEIPRDRIQYENGVLFFKADGKSRGKLGIPPQRASDLAGSYDAIHQILTITLFDVDPGAVYLNQEWKLEGDPFKGDAINAYNDGPLEDGSQMGPFYELESVSPAALLGPQESLTHDHTVIHLIGETGKLDQVIQVVLGTTLKEITNAL